MTQWKRAIRIMFVFAFVWVCSTSALYGQAVYGSIAGESTFDERAAEQLPTINRNFTQLVLLTPGAVQFNWNDTSTENPQGGIAVNVNGQHFTGVGYTLDGTDNRDFLYGNMIVVPDLDSVVQAKITSANFDAEFGQ